MFRLRLRVDWRDTFGVNVEFFYFILEIYGFYVSAFFALRRRGKGYGYFGEFVFLIIFVVCFQRRVVSHFKISVMAYHAPLWDLISIGIKKKFLFIDNVTNIELKFYFNRVLLLRINFSSQQKNTMTERFCLVLGFSCGCTIFIRWSNGVGENEITNFNTRLEWWWKLLWILFFVNDSRTSHRREKWITVGIWEFSLGKLVWKGFGGTP